MLIILILLSLVLFCFLVFMMNIKLDIIIAIQSPGNNISLKITTFYGLIRIKRDLPLSEIISMINKEELEKTEDTSTVSYETIIAVMKATLKDVVMLIKKIKIYIFEWSTQIGLGDASSSAIGAGTLWSIKGTIIAFIKSQLNFKNPPVIKVIPNFQGFSAQTYIKCMLKLKAGNAILTGYKILKVWKTYQKEADYGQYDHNQTIDRRIVNG